MDGGGSCPLVYRGRGPTMSGHKPVTVRRSYSDAFKRQLVAETREPGVSIIRYTLTRLPRLEVYLSKGRLEIDNNAAERSIRALPQGARTGCSPALKVGDRPQPWPTP